MQTVHHIAERLYDTPLATSIRESIYVFPALDVAHVLGIALLVGTVAIVDLRLLGVALTQLPLRKVAAQLLPWTWLGAIVMFTTGILLLLPQASRIDANPALQIKLVLIALAGINAWLLHRQVARHGGRWDVGAPPARVRIAGLLSLTLWVAIIVAGRLIAFVA